MKKSEEIAGIQLTGSDGRVAFFQHGGTSPIGLVAAQRPDQPSILYGFYGPTLNKVEKPDGRILTTEFQAGKVSAQYAPVGPNGQMCAIGRYEYQSNATVVHDAEGNKIVYNYDAHKKITSVDTYQGNSLYRKDRFTWDDKTGNLLRKTVEDASGHPFLITEYQYDKNHNPIMERIGDGNEWRTIHRTFSDDGFNLLLSESDREGKVTRYAYVPLTNLLAAELVYDKDKLVKRTFHTYDDCAVCVKTTCDDGSSEDPNHLQGVTYRKILSITPKKQIPCYGLPEIMEEKTLNPQGQEILLHKIVYTYASCGKVLKEDHYDREGTYRYSITNQYDDRERLVAKTQALGYKTSFTYDANHNLTSISGPRPDQHREITYDKANRPIRIADWQTDGTVLITEKKYDKLGRVIEELDECKNKTCFEYDSLSRLTAIIHADGAIERKEYDVLGNVTKEIDPSGYETRKSYNYANQVLSVDYADGSHESFIYNLTGTIAAHTEKNGSTTSFAYDIFDHPIKSTTYSSSKELLKETTACWTPFEKLSETEDDLTITYTYDFAGRKTGEQNGYKITHYTYDSLDRISNTTLEDTNSIEIYDVADQLIEKRTEKEGIVQFKEQYAYDEAGNRTHLIHTQGTTETLYNTDGKSLRIKDSLGFLTQFAYSYANSLTEVTTNPNGVQSVTIHDSRGREAQFLKKDPQTIQQHENQFDKSGNRISQTHTIFFQTTQIKTITHRWEYGPMGRMERFVEAGERETRYLYDDKGRLATILKPNGTRLQHEYDDLGRLIHFFSSDFDYRYTYDKRDRITAVYDKISDSVTKRSYDPLGNILNEILANGLSFTNVYDCQARRVSLSLPDSSSIDYIYDGIYLSEVKRGNYTHRNSERNLEGEITKVILPDNTVVHIERDAMGRYTLYQSPYYTATYPKNSYDGNGNLLGYQYHDPLGKVETHYSYDSLDQLTSEDNQTYLFDSLYNRLKKNDQTCTTDAFCQISHDGQTSYCYDACGNLISDGTCKYFYDSLDRLIAIETGDKRITYTYDPFHRRLSKTVFINERNSETIRYMWDGDNEIGCLNEKGAIFELRVLGEGLGNSEIGAAVLIEINGRSYIPIHDHRGCVVVLVDLKTRKPVETYRYTAFGEELTTNTLSPWRFASKRVELETGLVYFGRRYYSSSLGRWITPDPQGFDDGPNLYAYLHNCPLNDFDPYGLWSWGGMWGGTRDFFYGAGSYAWSGISGLGYGMSKMGEWMHADFQYEYFNDRSFFQDKSYRAVDGWKNFGKAAWKDPLGIAVPGIMEAWRNPTSPMAWGKAAVDIATIGFSAAKLGRVANFRGAERISEELAIFGKGENIASYKPKSLCKIDTNKLHHLFGQEKHKLHPLINKFGGKPEKAFQALDTATQKAFKEGRLNLRNGINTQTRINVNGIEIDLIGGRVINGRFEIGTVSRRDIK